MIKLFIDNQEADLNDAGNIVISLAVASFTELGSGKTGYSRTLLLPMTLRNRQLIGDADQIHAAASFNRQEHTARIEADGCTVMEGVPYLTACETGGTEGGCYRINLIGPARRWVTQAAETPLRNLGINFSETISEENVVASWSWDKPVRFLPVERDHFEAENYNANLFAPARVLTFEDYHPFLHIRTLLEEWFREAGYTICSEFIASEEFNTLYMSGNYPSHDMESLRNRMDFLAGRFDTAEATADRFGRVYADPLQSLNSLGNLVETADPKEEKNGKTVEGVYSVGGYFRRDGERMAFIPPEAVTLGFEYELFYTTEYYMESREQLRCFDTVSFSEGRQQHYRIVNRNTDRREQFLARRSYMAIVFGHTAGNSYQFRYNVISDSAVDPENPMPEELSTQTLCTFSSRTYPIAVSTSGQVTNPQLWIQDDNGSYVPYEGDWALYDGYVEERGEVEVSVTLRSAPERITPSQPKYFDQIYFGGAEQGMKLTLGQQVRIRPVFSAYPCEGTTVSFADVAAHPINGLDLINALKQLFNLRFYTDELERVVYIEPRDRFYRNDTIVDWRGRIDLSQPVRIEEAGVSMARTITLQYADGDGATARLNVQEGGKFGRWQVQLGNLFAQKEETIYENPLFCPTLNQSGDYPDAPSASLPQVGNREQETETALELNFPAKIVRYVGLVALPQSERWGWPSFGSEYPLSAFHLPGEYTLCFEDRDGMEGLHRFYDSDITLYDESRRVVALVRVRHAEIEALLRPNALRRDFRALFRLDLQGEEALFRLEEVSEYDPVRGIAKCIFIKECC